MLKWSLYVLETALLLTSKWACPKLMFSISILLSGVFLLAGSKWNQTVAPDEIIVRISEVLDWEEGGRTEEAHALRIFAREREEGARRVLAVMQRVSMAESVRCTGEG